MNEAPILDENVISMDEYKARPKPAMKEPPPGGEWLSAMRSGTEFLVRDKFGGLTPKFLVLEWIHGGLHPTGNVLLIPAKSPNETKNWQWVDPTEFCRVYEYRGIIWEPTDEDYRNVEELESPESGRLPDSLG